jgi:hypothetical protein
VDVRDGDRKCKGIVQRTRLRWRLRENLLPGNEPNRGILSYTEFDRCQTITNHELVRELPTCAHATPFEKGSVVRQESVITQNLLAANIELIDQGHAPTVCELPLLLWPIDEPAFMVQLSEPFPKARERFAPEECIQEVRAQVLIPIEELEEFNIARRQLDTLSRADATHA